MLERSHPLSPEQWVQHLGQQAKIAASELACIQTDLINTALFALAAELRLQTNTILEANAKDLQLAHEQGSSAAMIDRLALDSTRINSIAAGVEKVAHLEDPTGKIVWEAFPPNGLHIQRVSCPFGVLGMIYESRPNVTIDAAVLCLKSHNAVILRGGTESLHSASILHQIVQQILERHRIPKASVSMIPNADRAAVGAMLRAADHIDVMIPRGGRNLINRVMNEARMPVFSHLDGICHTYIHHNVDENMACNVVLNAKMRRTGICGAMESLLIDQKLAPSVTANILKTLLDAGCDIVGDANIRQIDARIGVATEEDWKSEYLDSKLSCRMVKDEHEAVAHINQFGSHHTDCILTQSEPVARYFFDHVDSCIVMHNTSSQFADGGEFGMGVEMGIATGKMHARGPVGLEQLCTYKYLVHGTGQIRP